MSNPITKAREALAAANDALTATVGTVHGYGDCDWCNNTGTAAGRTCDVCHGRSARK